MSRSHGLAALALLGSVALAACSNPAQAQKSTSDSRIQVLTSTSVYASLAEKIGGDLVDSVSLINSPSQDPHSYEATARDKLAVSKAQLVIGNGGGYDFFMDNLVQDSDLHEQAVLHAVDHSPVPAAEPRSETHDHEHEHEHDAHSDHQHANYNEHVWYDIESMRGLVPAIADRLATLDPENREIFEANAARLDKDLSGLESGIEILRGEIPGRHFAMTEPVPYHLLEDLGMEDLTPAGFSEAIEGGAEVSPQAFKEMTDLLAAGKIDVLAYNTQTASPQTERIRDFALKENVPVVEFSETLPPGTGYTDWMTGNLQAIESSIK